MPKAFTALPGLSLCHVVSLNRPTSGFNVHCLKRNISGELERKEKLVLGGGVGKNMFNLKPSSFYFIKLSIAKHTSGLDSHSPYI